jgi:ribonuclease HIII
MSLLDAKLAAFRALAQEKNFAIQDERKIDYGHQFKIVNGGDVVTVNFYTTGKVLVQGKTCDLKSEIESWAGQTSSPAQTGMARIGMDESGKGDYFGSLAAAAVYVDAASEPKLIRLGVKDSKALSEGRIFELENGVKILCPHAVIELSPEGYNALFDEMRNMNKVLAHAHAMALEKVLDQVSCGLAILDQFGDEKYVRNALLEKGKQIKLEQRPKAESDVAVAAASVLARAAFVRSMESLSKLVALDLPKGASDPSIEGVRQRIIKQYGQEMLAKVAKAHFNI